MRTNFECQECTRLKRGCFCKSSLHSAMACFMVVTWGDMHGFCLLFCFWGSRIMFPNLGFLSKLSSRQQGFLLMVVAVFCSPTLDVMAKYLVQSQPVMQVIWRAWSLCVNFIAAKCWGEWNGTAELSSCCIRYVLGPYGVCWNSIQGNARRGSDYHCLWFIFMAAGKNH